MDQWGEDELLSVKWHWDNRATWKKRKQNQFQI